MELRHIRHFVALAEALNFRRAAENLHMAQPPLSVSIHKLEEELGTKLFVRKATGVALTSDGIMVLKDARKLLFHEGQIFNAVRDGISGVGGRLYIGFVGTTTFGMLQRLVPPFRSEYPGVELVLKEAPSVSVLQQLKDGVLDIGLIRTPLLEPTDATLIQLEQDQFVVALPKEHYLACQNVLKIRDLANEPFVMYATGAAAGLRSAAMLACQQAGFIPRIAQQATQVQTLLALVESGLGVALVPSVMRRHVNDRIVYLELTDLIPGAAIGLSWAYMPQTESPAAAHFRALALSVFPRPRHSVLDADPLP